MIRRLFTLGPTLSLLLCLATVAIWVRSYWASPELAMRAGDHDVLVRAERGQAELSIGRAMTFYYLIPYPASPAAPTPADTCEHHLGGFGLTWTGYGGIPSRRLVVPNWFLAAVTAMPPLFWLLRRYRRGRRLRGRVCARCGYDLRASSDRCPECGAEVSSDSRKDRTPTGRWTRLTPVILICLAAAGCDCATPADQQQLTRYGGMWIGGGPFSNCGAELLWFEARDRQISDDDFAALLPAINRLHPQILQLYGQRQISDRSIDLINQIPNLNTVLVGKTALTTAGLRRLRPGIRVSDRPGSTVYVGEPSTQPTTTRASGVPEVGSQ